MRYAVCYVSTRTKEVSEEEINRLLKKWEKENSRNDVKGLLLYSEGSFFQVLVGDKEVILDLFEKIKTDPRHKDLMQIMGREITKGPMIIISPNISTVLRKEKPKLFRNICMPSKEWNLRPGTPSRISLRFL